MQYHSYSPVEFCISIIPVYKLLQQSKGYRTGGPGNRNMKRTHSVCGRPLTTPGKPQSFKDVNKIIVEASHDREACSGVAKSAEIYIYLLFIYLLLIL